MKTTGWIVAIAAFGMMCTLVSGDVAQLKTLNDVWSPLFISNILAHLGAVIAAFIGGNLIPNLFDKSGK